MSTLAAFFKGSETRFGVFSPKNYLLAIFPNYAAAAQAERSLREAGLPEEDVISVPGADMLQLAEEEQREGGVLSKLMQGLNHLLEAEMVYLEHDLGLARQGAGFLFAYAPHEDRKERVWQILAPREPIVARHYGLAAIDHLKGET